MSEIYLTILPLTALRDLRYGARMLRRNAGHTFAAVLALELAIGGNTVAFTAADDHGLRAALINDTMANTLWRAQNAIVRRIRTGPVESPQW